MPEWQPPEHKNHAPQTRPKKEPPVKEEKEPEPEEVSLPWTKGSKKDLSHAKKYLASRAITLDPLPECIKWGNYKDRKTGETVNMIVFAASKPDDKQVFAVQRLFIDMDDHTKSGAKMLGNCHGRGVWFDRQGDVTELVVSEGVETTLSGMQATGKNGVAALSTAGMKKLDIPDATNTIHICTDSDPVREKEAASMPGQKAAYILAEKFEASREGRTAFIVSPDDSCFTGEPAKLDFNDLLKEDPTGETIRTRFEKAVPFKELTWKPPVKDEDDSRGGGSGSAGYPRRTYDALMKMNQEYAGVLLGSDWRIVKESFDKETGRSTVAFLKQSALYAFMGHIKVPVLVGENKDTAYRELAKVWSNWKYRRVYENVIFNPSKSANPNAYNLFRGFPLKAKQGDWSLMRKHVLDVICDGNEEHFAYVMGWMARAVQDPGGDKPGVAIVLKGGKGIGKGVFVNYFGSIFGEAFLPIADSESFTGRFNMHLSKSLVVFLDEAVWGGDKKAEGKLKQLITEPKVLFEPKGIDSMTLDNYINVIIASNEEWVVPATGDERRFCVLQPSEDFKQDTEYFGRIINERKNGGAEAMMYELLQFDYSGIDLRRAPMTVGLSEQVQQSLPSVLEFWYSVLDRGFALSDRETGRPKKSELIREVEAYGELWPLSIFKHEIHTEYTQWCRTKNERYVDSEVHFWRTTRSIWPGGKLDEKRSSERSGRWRFLVLPELSEIRASFTKKTNIIFEEQEEDNDMVAFNGQF